MSLTAKLYRVIDLVGGVWVGSYRSGYFKNRPVDKKNRNENEHYVIDDEEINKKIRSAKEGVISSSAYPIAFWIERLIKDVDGAVICDFGGGYGQDYFRFARLLSKPVRWNVTEIPELVQIAKGFHQLQSVDFSESPPEADILYSNGVVMNADGALFDAISKTKPKSLIITSVECVDTETFYTWQVTRKTGRRCIYVTYNRREFVGVIESFGYSLAAEWEAGRSGSGVFLSSDIDVRYYGFAFVRF